jgi:hypothetical protein
MSGGPNRTAALASRPRRNVRYGSAADIIGAKRNVRFEQKTGHNNQRPQRLLIATSGNAEVETVGPLVWRGVSKAKAGEASDDEVCARLDRIVV